MAGIFTFALGLALGFAVSPWWFALSGLVVLATVAESGR